MNGFYNVLKPSGITSSDVVVKIRHLLKQHDIRVKVGHLGTLDPLGAGVLPVAVGSATKLFNYLIKKNKLYRTKFIFGITTDTLDSEGVIVDRQPANITVSDIERVIPLLCGKIEQMPPDYSSKSVDGVRAYKLARQGITVELKPNLVDIYQIKLVEGADNQYTFDILCGGGTYIRSICRDMAYLLNTCGYMASIIRLESGAFTIENANTIEEIANDMVNNLVTTEDYASNLNKYCIKCDVKMIDNGVPMSFEDMPDNLFELYVNNMPYGIATKDNKRLKVILRYDS